MQYHRLPEAYSVLAADPSSNNEGYYIAYVVGNLNRPDCLCTVLSPSQPFSLLFPQLLTVLLGLSAFSDIIIIIYYFFLLISGAHHGSYTQPSPRVGNLPEACTQVVRHHSSLAPLHTLTVDWFLSRLAQSTRTLPFLLPTSLEHPGIHWKPTKDLTLCI